MFSRLKPRTTPPDGDSLVVGALPDRVRTARERLAHQADPALTAALSEAELAANRAVAERIREHERLERLAQVETAESTAEQVRRAHAEILRADAQDLVTARRALAEQRRQASPHAQLANLYRIKKWSGRALAGVVAAAMVWSAVNVQHNVAPGGPTDPLYWASYLVEGLISTVLVVFMVSGNAVARWKITEGETLIRWTEAVLLAATITLNTYPYLRVHAWFDAAVHAVAPIMIGVALVAQDAVSKRLGAAIAVASAEVPADDDITDRLAELSRVAQPATKSATEQPGAEQPGEWGIATEHPHGAPAPQRPMVAAAEHEPSTPVAVRSTQPAEQSSPAATEHSAEQRSTAMEQSAEHLAEHELSSLRSTPPATEHPAEQRSTPASATETASGAVEPDDAQTTERLVEPVAGQSGTQETAPVRQSALHPATRVTEQRSTAAEHAATEHPATAAQQPAEHEPSSPASLRSSQRSTPVPVRSTLRSTSAVAQRLAEQPTEHRRVATEHARAERSTPRSTQTGVTEHPTQAHGAPPVGITVAVWNRAHEVRRSTGARSSAEQIAHVLARHDEHPEHGASRIARDLKVGFTSVRNWLEADAQRHTGTGAQVIELRK
ncbi:hypothetical protein [Nocardia asiatica]|uniref:hypothetical protein n=1 Tax=Nocardia asiatica TaxID=209252 RepID=UPI003EE0CFC2